MMMFGRTGSIAIMLGLTGAVCAQTNNTTTGACSPIVTQNRGPVTIECQGVPEALQRQLVDILNSILQKQLDPTAVMSKLDEIAKGMGDLKKNSFDAERGLLLTYDFNGIRREQRPGAMTASDGPETVAFQKMRELATAKLWVQLAELCEAQIISAPKWLAPYYFAGGRLLRTWRQVQSPGSFGTRR
jgi:hypothetical protein